MIQIIESFTLIIYLKVQEDPNFESSDSGHSALLIDNTKVQENSVDSVVLEILE